MNKLLFTLILLIPVGGLNSASGSCEFSSELTGTTIEVSRVDEENRCTLIFETMSLRTVLTEITNQMGIELEGFEGLKRTILVSANLRERPLRQALEYLLGSVDLRYTLRTNALTIRDANDRDIERPQLLQIASAAYFRAQARFPGHKRAPGARINQGILERERGNWIGALEHYQEIRENYSDSDEALEAIYLAGRMHLKLEQWSEASLTFRELINLRTKHEFRVEGMKGFARSLIELGDEETALHTLAIIDKGFLATEVKDRRERLLLRAEALTATDKNIDCLRILESLQSSALEEHELAKVHELRARAFDGLDMPAEAGRSWLLFVETAEGSERDAAIIKATELALASNDELAVLFISSTVTSPDLRQAITPYIREANVRMGLSNLGSLDSLNSEERLSLAERHINVQRYDDADLALAPILDDRDELPDNLRSRFVLAWTSVLENTVNYKSALDFLSEERPYIEQIDNRKPLDIRAAAIFERNGLPEKAVDAFRGNY